jgi:nitrile hydratase subunit beta
MNGIHDMGGMQTFGPMLVEKNEPVFHASWQGRIMALYRAIGAWGKWNIDIGRQSREVLPPAEYLALGYYETRYVQTVSLIVQYGMATQAEIDSGTPASGIPKATPALKADQVGPFMRRGNPKRRDVAVTPSFRPGERVRTRIINPPTHTRLPRYARGRLGIVERDHGIFVFPDSNAQHLGEKPQHLYSVRFAARELWGDKAKPRDSLYLDLWDDYLEPA